MFGILEEKMTLMFMLNDNVCLFIMYVLLKSIVENFSVYWLDFVMDMLSCCVYVFVIML